MIRWTEQTEVYRLEYSHRLQEIASSLVAVVFGILCFAALFGFLKVVEDAKWWRGAPFLVLGFVAALVMWFAGRTSTHYGPMRGWVEVSVRGCTVRWGGPQFPDMPSPIAVTCFQVSYDDRARGGIDAVRSAWLLNQALQAEEPRG